LDNGGWSYIYLGMKRIFQIEEVTSANFTILSVVVFPIIIGALLRLPCEVKENKKWAFDWSKFIAIGLPAS